MKTCVKTAYDMELYLWSLKHLAKCLFCHEPCLLICTISKLLYLSLETSPLNSCFQDVRTLGSIRCCINNVRVNWPHFFLQKTFPSLCMLSFLVHIISYVYFILPFLVASILYKAAITLLSKQRNSVLLKALPCMLNYKFTVGFLWSGS